MSYYICIQFLWEGSTQDCSFRFLAGAPAPAHRAGSGGIVAQQPLIALGTWKSPGSLSQRWVITYMLLSSSLEDRLPLPECRGHLVLLGRGHEP